MVARRAASHTIAKSGVAQNCEPNEYVRDRRDANFASPQMTRRPIAGYRLVSYQRDHQYSFVDVLKDIIERQGPFTDKKGFRGRTGNISVQSKEDDGTRKNTRIRPSFSEQGSVGSSAFLSYIESVVRRDGVDGQRKRTISRMSAAQTISGVLMCPHRTAYRAAWPHGNDGCACIAQMMFG